VEIDRIRKFRTVSMVVTVIGLVVIAAVLTWLVVVTTRQAQHSDERTREGLVRLAYVSLVLLGMTLVLLGWVVVRHLITRGGRKADRRPTPYVNAWEEAGRRFQLDESDLPEDQEPPDSAPPTMG